MSPDHTDPSTALKLVVDEVRKECDGVLTLSLIDGTGSTLPTWEAGAHIDLHLANGMVRQYSLHNAPGDSSRYEVAVLRDPNSRGGSQHIHDEVTKGATLTASLPRNNFPLKPAQEYLFVAAGIGITPLLPMMAAAAEKGIAYRLVYAGRSRPKMAFFEQLSDDDNVQMCVSDEGTRLNLDALIGDDLDPNVHIYSCGPERLLDALTARCADLGVSAQLHVEHFSGTAVELDPSVETVFEVELSRTGKTLTVGPDQTILDALLECGIKAANSCGEGVCGSCETTVLEGEVDHRDAVLDDDEKAENEVMMICCSRARSPRIVLDM
ncbi:MULTISPECIES: PDR/VanB family oxidoreductase [unclassified Rhodococcus (in: high G+C Gram-positive bacteria)]|uniref:PDR/VanB family oxidoreductase n=1 Tax=unclassified Rhodococcus (in: high G+C Gram-positive bacteria) TaxID=192944 RepID=UPI00163AC8EA|nr:MULTISPECIES: PDR/VanB family oxidoreductase [unclassified Rhodococcus (in: high G+C Gram-positive bacteria)]MBC2637869.1 oxidoreductase [Rhodococcus sp. 3A]MBC2897383.1 oxidoreductase [Rhodococcus sp. 4CII]